MNSPAITLSRRQWATAAFSSLAVSALAQQPGQDENRYKICAFTKPFNSLSFTELAERMAEIGFDGIEAPIRRGGHIEPPAVPDRLPELVEALAQQGLEITVMTSDINDPTDPLTERVLRTASMLGIKRYRMKYFKYDSSRSIEDQLADWHAQLKDLAAMNHEFGLRAVYQNHAGNGYLGAPLWDLDRVLEDVSPDDVAVAYDIRHATAEGGMSWPTTFRMIRPHVDTVYVKDFAWQSQRGRPVNVPLGEGRVDPKFFDMLKASGFTGPISLHEEYLDHRDPKLVPDHLAALKADLATLKDWLA